MIKTEPIVFICHQKSICFIAFLACNAWNLHHVHLKLESYGQRDHKKSWNYIRRVTCKTTGPWSEAQRNGSLENELKMITEVNFGSVRAQSRPLTTPHTLLPLGFLICSMGIISVLIAPRWEKLKWPINNKHCYYQPRPENWRMSWPDLTSLNPRPVPQYQATVYYKS